MPKVDTVTFLPCDFWKELAYFDVYLNGSSLSRFLASTLASLIGTINI